MNLEVIAIDDCYSVKARFRQPGSASDDVTLHNIRYGNRSDAETLLGKLKRMLAQDRRNGTSEIADYVSNRHYWNYLASVDDALIGTSGQVIQVGKLVLPRAA